jgi:hypothetical protein
MFMGNVFKYRWVKKENVLPLNHLFTLKEKETVVRAKL